MASTNDLKNGMVLNIDGQLWSVVEFQHVKPGKGGAFVRTKLKSVMSGKVVDRTFNAGTRVDTATVDKRDMQYLYRDGSDFVFMDTDTYDQISLPEDLLGEAAEFLQDGMQVKLDMYNEKPVSVELPQQVEATIVEADAVVKGQTASSSYKPAVLDNGVKVLVPPHITAGTRIVVDVYNREYVRRAD